jgi:opacity protein-like surface antigen
MGEANMKSNFLIITLAFTLLSSMANAADNTSYISISGLNGKSSLKVAIGNQMLSSSSYKEGFSPYGAGIALGTYFLPNFRSEVGVNFLKGNKKTRSSYGYLGSSTNIEYKSLSLMFNSYYDFKNSSVFTPYLVGGLGISHNKATFATTINGVSIGSFNKSKNSLSWLVGAGVDAKVTNNIIIGMGYRYVTLSTNSIKFTNDSDFSKIKIKPAHLMVANLRWEF